MGDSEAVLYGSDDSHESGAMVKLLNELGVKFDFRHIDRDPRAMREWEQLDGDRVPMLRVGNNQIIRGFDRIKLQQLFGWVGCCRPSRESGRAAFRRGLHPARKPVERGQERQPGTAIRRPPSTSLGQWAPVYIRAIPLAKMSSATTAQPTTLPHCGRNR